MGFIEIILIVLGWFALKFGILNHTSFETSFLAGIVYNYTALIVIAIVCVYRGIRENTSTPTFIDAFKSIAKKVITYSVLASLSITVWHHYIIQDINAKRLEEIVYEKQNAFETDEEYAEFVSENPGLQNLSREEWIEKETESVKLIYSMGIQTSLTMMLYLVLGLFISLIASFLWTKVWFTQQRQN